MQSSAELKRQAKESLKGRWGQAVLLNLIPTLIGIVAILLIMIPIILFATATYDGSANVSDAMASGSGSSGGGGGIISSIISALFMSGILGLILMFYVVKKIRLNHSKMHFVDSKVCLSAE